MNLAGITKSAINVGFKIANQITITTTYNRVGGSGEPTYDAGTGEVSANVLTLSGVSAMLLSFSAKEIDGEKVRDGDERLIVRTSELPGLNEPARDDYLIDTNNVRRDVIDFRADPTKTFWILHCRRNSG